MNGKSETRILERQNDGFSCTLCVTLTARKEPVRTLAYTESDSVTADLGPFQHNRVKQRVKSGGQQE